MQAFGFLSFSKSLPGGTVRTIASLSSFTAGRRFCRILRPGSFSLPFGSRSLLLPKLALLVCLAHTMEALSPESFRMDFMEVLLTRRTGEVPLHVERAAPVTDPNYQGSFQFPRVAMESCPRKDVGDPKIALVEENFYLFTEAGEQGKMPVLVLKLRDKTEKMPAIVILHSSYKTKEWVRPLLEAYASRGYVAVAVDARYHGERAKTLTYYRDVWDLIKLADYLTQRVDVNSSKIGITGESLGGMHAWFAAAADSRYSVVVPIIGIQGFHWALENDKWQARVDSIKPVFEEARVDLGKPSIDRGVVEKVWDRIAPGLAHQFDAPDSVPVIAPRPLLILNGQDDPRCPIGGLQDPISRTIKAYEDAKLPHNFKFIAQPGIEHLMTVEMVIEASNWFDKFLN
ncbi:hypothetical protein EJ110_NYTH41730 [Nymphaea thermarum]|nr:hypothetical protein EJ110_NYTH41730 [Nymphaea thermarum]